jgi:hypothetical protein
MYLTKSCDSSRLRSASQIELTLPPTGGDRDVELDLARSRNTSEAVSFSLDRQRCSFSGQSYYSLKRRNEEIQVVDFWDLLDKFRKAAHKLLRV